MDKIRKRDGMKIIIALGVIVLVSIIAIVSCMIFAEDEQEWMDE